MIIEKHKALPSSREGFGVELEFCVGIGEFRRIRNLSTIKFLNFEKNSYCCVKEDCSCGSEVNLGIYPLSIRGINHFIKHIDLIYEDLRSVVSSNSTPYFTYRNLMDERCGMHVHLSRSLFSEKTIRNFLKYFRAYEKDIFNYCVDSCRSSNNYVRRMTSVNYLTENIEESDLKHFFLGYGHYEAVNYNPYHQTIEIRYSGMTANVRSVKTWLQIILFLFKKSKKEFIKFNSLEDHMKSLSKRSVHLLGSWMSLPSEDKFTYDLWKFKKKEETVNA